MIRILIFIVAGMSFVYVTTTKLATLPIPDANPDSRIYFMDNWAEKLKLLTIKDPEEKLGKLMEYSDEKMGEIQYLLDNEKDIKLLEKVLPKHERYIEEALGQLA
ncbi:MAG: hypothetical protein HQ536_04950 [Parcubacteria group bacterium]|nr:hypothetical protein [Parcubacteria group bacterium]